MPFITEEIHHILDEKNGDIIVGGVSRKGNVNNNYLCTGDRAGRISFQRSEMWGKTYQPERTELPMFTSESPAAYDEIRHVITRLGNISAIEKAEADIEKMPSLLCRAPKSFTWWSTKPLMLGTGCSKNGTEQLNYQRGFASVEKKLQREIYQRCTGTCGSKPNDAKGRCGRKRLHAGRSPLQNLNWCAYPRGKPHLLTLC